MTAEEYLETKSEMCKAYKNDCSKCAMTLNDCHCGAMETLNQRRALNTVNTVKRWNKKYIEKITYLDYYKAIIAEKAKLEDENITETICMIDVFYPSLNYGRCLDFINCKECWNDELPKDLLYKYERIVENE